MSRNSLFLGCLAPSCISFANPGTRFTVLRTWGRVSPTRRCSSADRSWDPCCPSASPRGLTTCRSELDPAQPAQPAQPARCQAGWHPGRYPVGRGRLMNRRCRPEAGRGEAARKARRWWPTPTAPPPPRGTARKASCSTAPRLPDPGRRVGGLHPVSCTPTPAYRRVSFDSQVHRRLRPSSQEARDARGAYLLLSIRRFGQRDRGRGRPRGHCCLALLHGRVMIHVHS